MTEATPPPAPQGGVSRIDLIRQIVLGWQAERIRIDGKKVYVDAFTASAVLAVYEALNPENAAKFIALPWDRMITVTWKMINGPKKS